MPVSPSDGATVQLYANLLASAPPFASDEARYVIGAEYAVDGGHLAGDATLAGGW